MELRTGEVVVNGLCDAVVGDVNLWGNAEAIKPKEGNRETTGNDTHKDQNKRHKPKAHRRFDLGFLRVSGIIADCDALTNGVTCRARSKLGGELDLLSGWNGKFDDRA